MSAFRPLPPRPSLEFEHKEAKALLRRLRAGDPESLARAREQHPGIEKADRIRLADAQLVIAREYGFASWPKLVRYFRDVERPRFQGAVSLPTHLESQARSMMREHQNRRATTARILAAYVPRFYGMRPNDVLSAAVTATEDEARLAVARLHGFRNWDDLIQCARTQRELPRDWDVDPIRQAGDAMRAGDIDALKRVVEAHPDLLHPMEYDVARGYTLLNGAIGAERSLGRAAMKPIIEWLATQGLDIRQELNRRLCRPHPTLMENVRYLLERGADPNWISPSGMPVLEHALISYWNGEAVDLIAARVKPRKALWIAAGLGDVKGVRRSLDRDGKPKPAAVKLRPDFDAAGPMKMAAHPEPEPEELLMEAFFVAMLNGRTNVLEYMVSRGFPVDSRIWGMPMINFAVGNLLVPVVECLVRCGADPDARASSNEQSARELATEWFEQDPKDAKRKRVVDLLGLDPSAILAARDARPIPTPGFVAAVDEALELAGDDAFRHGQSGIGLENLFVGLLRAGGWSRELLQKSRVDVARFREDWRERLEPKESRLGRPKLPLDDDAQAALKAAIAVATERRRDVVYALHVLYALVQQDQGVIADLLERYGSSPAIMRATLDSTL